MEQIEHDYNFNICPDIIKVIAILVIGGLVSFMIWKGSDSSIIELVIISLLSFATGFMINPAKKEK